MPLPQSVIQDTAAVERHLSGMFDGLAGPATRLVGAMRYATMNGGKRLRAALVMASSRLAGGVPETDGALNVAAAVECLHAYSLIHDDLPAMDDAATRRGEPACHVAFDEATAILAGDALQTLAFGLLSDPATHDDPGAPGWCRRWQRRPASREWQVARCLISRRRTAPCRSTRCGRCRA